MSQENVEVVRRSLQAYADGDVGDRVVGFGHIHARGRESGLELDSVTGWVFDMRAGKVPKAQGFLSREDALDAAGLGE